MDTLDMASTQYPSAGDPPEAENNSPSGTDISKPSDTDEWNTSAPGPEQIQYHIQVGAFRMEMYANRLLEELLEQDYPAFISHTGGFYRVQVGTYDSLDEAVLMERRLKRAGYPTVIVA